MASDDKPHSCRDNRPVPPMFFRSMYAVVAATSLLVVSL